MATFVIVHGGWGGGWEWTPVARMLRARGHEVFTPTLTGLGERAHLGADIDLADHVEDVLAVFTFEELRAVVLCGHSSGGMVVTGVADRLPDRVRLLIYLDAFVPTDGEALHDLIPREFGDLLLQAAEERGDGRIPYPPELQPPEGLIPEEVRTSYIRRTRPHPAGDADVADPSLRCRGHRAQSLCTLHRRDRTRQRRPGSVRRTSPGRRLAVSRNGNAARPAPLRS